jgi:hypothetical protein
MRRSTETQKERFFAKRLAALTLPGVYVVLKETEETAITR